jgi:phosphatidylglycerol:prolipoprotein diacylglycerol transferase
MMSGSSRTIEIAIGVVCLLGWLACTKLGRKDWLASALNMGAFLVGLHLGLSYVMAERLPDGSLSETPITIFSFGVIIIIAFFVASAFMLRQTRPLGIEDKKIFDWCFWMLVVGVAGSRVLYAYLNYEQFVENKFEIFKIWHGGLVWYGGLIPAAIVGIWLLGKHKLPVLHVADVGSAALMLALGLGRWACLLAGDDYGQPTDAWFGIRFYHEDSLVPDGLRGVPLHPTQMYMSVMCLWIFFAVEVIRRNSRRAGQAFAWMLILYAVGRAGLIEPFRGDFVERNPAYGKRLATALVFREGENDVAVSLKRGDAVQDSRGRTGKLLSDLELAPGEGGYVFAITDERADRVEQGPFAGRAPNWTIDTVTRGDETLLKGVVYRADPTLRRRHGSPNPWYDSDLPVPPGYVSTSQWISIFVIAAGVSILLGARRWNVPGYTAAVASRQLTADS